MTRKKIGVALIFLLLVGIVLYQAIDRSVQSIRLAFAEEQCHIFAEMADKAVAALNRDPPDTTEAIQCLEYTHNYYPSGTKQRSGSRIDSIVENARRLSELRIIQALKIATNSDFGNDARVWIEHFNK